MMAYPFNIFSPIFSCRRMSNHPLHFRMHRTSSTLTMRSKVSCTQQADPHLSVSSGNAHTRIDQSKSSVKEQVLILLRMLVFRYEKAFKSLTNRYTTVIYTKSIKLNKIESY